MSKINCLNCKHYDFNACDGVDWCKLNHEETGICGNCDREFEDLEEATTHYDALVEENNTFLMENSKMAGEIKDLQSQLAEKEKEILDIKFMMRNTEQALRNVPNAMAGQRKRIDELTKELKQDNQDKISFAVEQLTEIRDYVKECWSLETTEGKVRLDIAKKIRLKIEELTHQHEDKGE